MDDVSNRRAIRKVQRVATARDNRLATTLAWIMSTTQGREWVYTLLEQCHIGTTSFVADPYITAFRSGEQNIGIQIWATIQNTCPVEYSLAIREANERSAANTRRSGDQPDGGRVDGGHVDEAGSDADGPDEDGGTGEGTTQS